MGHLKEKLLYFVQHFGLIGVFGRQMLYSVQDFG